MKIPLYGILSCDFPYVWSEKNADFKIEQYRLPTYLAMTNIYPPTVKFRHESKYLFKENRQG